MQCGALGLLGAILAMLLRSHAKEQATLLALAGCCLLVVMAAQLLQPVADFLEQLSRLGKLEEDLVAVLLKTAGVALLTEVADTVCSDAGEAAMGKMIRLCGGAAELYLAMPLFLAVLELLERMIGE